LFPGEEDFGMAPLEIAAAGRPTIAFKAGGATETIVPGITGVFFEEQAPESLMGAIHELEGITWNQGAIRAHAKLFGIEVFERAMMDFLVDLGFSFPDRATPLSVCNV
jgi:glycosyltransferase involved in cell wall biosynthesis